MNRKAVIAGGALIAAAVGIYFLTKGGNLPVFSGPGESGSVLGTGNEPADNPIVYQFPPEGTVNFPSLPTFNEVFGAPGSGSKKTDLVNAMPGDVIDGITLKAPFVSSSSSNALGGTISPAMNTLGQTVLGALVGSFFGAPGAALVAVGSIVKDTPQGQQAIQAVSQVTGSKKEIESRSPAGTVLANPGYNAVRTPARGTGGGGNSSAYGAALSSAIQSSANVTTVSKKGNSVIQNYNAYKSAGGTAAPFV